ncbi:interferon-induced protein with tetratricopeptide repeats 1-like [Pseudoliparis swirei]|uniref:interferon-induced protein with tetratricopeptide repeats 1-like n=1 Tax=Pseudoliparis swirei TaxID=2059687 RepID=UPI0024BE38B5|nr:interferon-induced protein with tetratricopeptide repeats 1-like [Pseudoliparis swirei]
MMACSQSKKQLVAKLEALQCHFTWNMETNKKKLLRINDMLVDIGTEEGNSWLGHIYNLQGFIQYQLGSTEDAQSFFNKAAEAFRQMRKADGGPWLVVNYGNLAWLHHHLGDQAESEAYLSKVDALMKKYPSPSQDELHAETYAEKAWTLMKFSTDRELVADCFQRAIKMQPEMVEWNTSYVLGLVSDFKYRDNEVEADILEKMRVAQEQDPENFYLAACYLEQRGKKGEDVKDEARELAVKVLRNPVSSYNGIKAILRVYRNYVSIDEAIALAEEALELHPDERYLKRCAALCLKWKIIFSWDRHTKQSMIDRAVSLHEEVISLYPDSSLVKKIDLANIHAKSNNGMDRADQMYQDLLILDLEPAEKQLLYNQYAKYLKFDRNDSNQSVRYHMKAAVIPVQSFYRANSINLLEKIKNKSWNRMGREIEEFLENLQEP